MSAHDQNQDEREKIFEAQSEPSVAGNEQGKFTQIFFQPNASSKAPVSGNDPIDPKNVVVSGHLGDSQPDQRFVNPTTGDFTRVFGKAPVQPPSNEFAFNRPKEPASAPPSFPETPREAAPREAGAFTRVFGKGANQLLQGQPNTSPTPTYVQPEAFSPAPPRPSVSPIFPEKDFSQSSTPVREPFEERIAPPKPDGFSDIFRDLKQTRPDGPLSKFQELSAPAIPAAAIPIGTQPSASTPASDDLFADDKPSLNAVKLPGGPSDYTRVVNASAVRPSQEGNGVAAPPAPPAPQAAPQAPQMPQYQMPPMTQMPQPLMMQAPQMIPSAPMIQTPTVAPLPQPVPPQAQPWPSDAANSKWASYMPLIIALNAFLLLAMLLILIVFLASKK